MTKYISQLPGFYASIKQRFSDFLVYECEPDGTVVHLISLSPPAEKETESKAKTKDNSGDVVAVEENIENNLTAHLGSSPTGAETEDGDIKVDGGVVSVAKPPHTEAAKGTQSAELARLVGEDFFARLVALDKEPGLSLLLPSTGQNKEDRTRLHRLITASFDHLASATIREGTGDEEQVWIEVNHSSKGQERWNRGKRGTDVSYSKTGAGEDGRLGQRDRPPPFIKFVLLKSNKDTLSAISLLAQLSRIHVSRFAYAGTKDRRAITTQWVTVQGVSANRIAGLNKRLLGMRCGMWIYSVCTICIIWRK